MISSDHAGFPHLVDVTGLSAAGGGPLFASWNGEWLDPSNVSTRIAKACKAVGYEWVSSHAWRRTVGTHLRTKGIRPTAIGGQLGNTAAVAEKYYGAKASMNPETAAAMETIFNEETGTDGP